MIWINTLWLRVIISNVEQHYFIESLCILHPNRNRDVCDVDRDTCHSAEWWRNQPAVDGNETAAYQSLRTEHIIETEASRKHIENINASQSASYTWMSCSLELNSDTSWFSPSDTLVNETHSRREARRWASEGRLRWRPDFRTLTRLKVGWSGPRFLFLASLATSITSSQHLAWTEEEKGEFQDQSW